MLAAGKEGTIIKDGVAIWRDGTSKQQVKLKLEAECDLVIVGFTEGNGKNKATFGSIRAQTSDGLLEVGVSGFKDKKQKGMPTRSEINDMRKELLGTIMTVKFNDIMYPSEDGKLYSLFLPRYAEFRRDKTTADSLERVIEQYEAAKAAHVGVV
jgi:DNA ligase-1